MLQGVWGPAAPEGDVAATAGVWGAAAPLPRKYCHRMSTPNSMRGPRHTKTTRKGSQICFWGQLWICLLLLFVCYVVVCVLLCCCVVVLCCCCCVCGVSVCAFFVCLNNKKQQQQRKSYTSSFPGGPGMSWVSEIRSQGLKSGVRHF